MAALHIHHVPGRLRVRIAELRRDTDLAQAVQAAVATACGIKSVEVNAITGSVLVYYDPTRLRSSNVLALIGEHCDVRPVPPERSGSGTQRKLADAVFWYAVEQAVERSVPLVLAALL